MPPVKLGPHARGGGAASGVLGEAERADGTTLGAGDVGALAQGKAWVPRTPGDARDRDIATRAPQVRGGGEPGAECELCCGKANEVVVTAETRGAGLGLVGPGLAGSGGSGCARVGTPAIRRPY
jgi:hypothetical protein